MIDNSKEKNNGQHSIKNWAEADRPREKMMARGEEALTNAELLAILIGSGNAHQSAVELMQEVLKSCGERLANLSKMSINELMLFNGIGEAKALTIKAAAEIGRRRTLETASDIIQVKDAETVYNLMRPIMQDLGHEEFWALLLNNNARLIRKLCISRGGITQTAVDIRTLLKEALLNEATCMIVCHNHPSGSLNPSQDDRSLTQRINAASGTLNIRLIDHVIITDGEYYSFAENGKI